MRCEEYNAACIHVLHDGVQPTIDREGDALCIRCRRSGKAKIFSGLEIVPAAELAEIVARWGIVIRARV